MRRLLIIVPLAAAALGGCEAPAPGGTETAATPAAPAPGAAPPALRPVFRALDSLLLPTQREAIGRGSADDLYAYHHSLGLYVRNEFGLWRGGPLRDYLAGLGLSHPDDMSMIVLRAYRHHLRGEAVDGSATVREELDARRDDLPGAP